MVKETKFYDLLEVTPDVGEADLKKAYRKRALRLHPDKGGDPELFKEVTHAYEILSDPQKRSIYDARGEAGLNEQGGMGGMDPQDLFSQLFGGGGGGFFGGGGPRGPQGPRKGKDLVHRVNVTLEELYKGKTSRLALTRHVICAKCSGKGGKDGAVRTCPGCNGRGIRVIMRQMGPMIQQIQQACNECDGSGEIIKEKDRCKTCNGKKTVQERKMLDVHIDKGMKDGQAITFAGESDQAPDTIPGDVVIIVQEKPHDRFKRKDNDLYHDLDIDLLSALGGGHFAVKHLDERVLHVNLRPGEVIKPGHEKVIQGQGMPNQRHHDLGDLYIKFNVVFPDSLSPDVIPHLEKALPPRTPLPDVPKGYAIDEVDIEELDARQRRNVERRSDDAMDEDEEGQPRVQCQNQ
jgi:DnaJ family protein A protein 2